MSTLVKILAALILSIALTSCQFDFIGSGERGNGNVVSADRNVEGSFNSVDASEGLDVIVAQGDVARVSVEADENLHELILTEVKGNTLKVHCKKAVGRATAKKIFVTMPDIKRLESSSGADLWTTGVIRGEAVSLSASSGADLQAEVEVTNLELNTSSGADIEVSGSANSVMADASSGSDINAGALKAVEARAEASSGADVTVNSTDKIEIHTSSGGDVHYRGNPAIVQKSGDMPEKLFKN